MNSQNVFQFRNKVNANDTDFFLMCYGSANGKAIDSDKEEYEKDVFRDDNM